MASYHMIYPEHRTVTSEWIIWRASDAYQNGQLARKPDSRPEWIRKGNPEGYSVDDCAYLLSDAGLCTFTDF